VGNQWPSFDDETHGSQVNRIGNLCLLAEDDNSSFGNDGFSAKRVAYANSSFKLTKEIGQEQAWTKDEIEARSKKLAGLATKTWPLSVDMVKPTKKKP